MDITRIKRGGLNLRFSECDLRELLEAASQMVGPNVQGAKQTFEFDVPDEPLLVRGDADRLIQVFGNLLFNAYKFTPDGGSIRVEARAEGDRATVRIIDTGNGMSQEHLTRVFELFAQVGEHTSNRPVGLGVGLALAKQIIDLHLGQIHATSDGPGLGSTFTVSLVLLRQKPSHSARPRGFANLSVQAAKRVLVVDDNKDAADTICLLLGIDGHEVSVAYCGSEAIERCEAIRPDIVLLDLGMPDMSGHDVAKAILASERCTGVRLIALTGWGQEEDFERSKQAGFHAHLVKPVSLSKLRELIAACDPIPETA
jgi:CheY-like chemotaxis protein